MASRLVDAPAWALSDGELVDRLEAVHAAEQVLAAVRLHLIREVDGRNLPGVQGATGVAVWLRGRLRVSILTAKRWVELARLLDGGPRWMPPWPPGRERGAGGGDRRRPHRPARHGGPGCGG
jgi:hypothetical protein